MRRFASLLVERIEHAGWWLTVAAEAQRSTVR
jgi:hypothetical protein